jgi:hypothetical protein
MSTEDSAEKMWRNASVRHARWNNAAPKSSIGVPPVSWIIQAELRALAEIHESEAWRSAL